MRLEGPTRTGCAAGRDDDDVGCLQDSPDESWPQCNGARGGVAAGDGYPARPGQRLAALVPPWQRHLRQTVGPGADVTAAIETLPLLGIGQPEVRATVDHDHVVSQLVHDRG